MVLGLSVTRRHESPEGSKLAFLAVPNSEEEIEITFLAQTCGVQEDLMRLAFEVESMEKFEKHHIPLVINLVMDLRKAHRVQFCFCGRSRRLRNRGCRATSIKFQFFLAKTNYWIIVLMGFLEPGNPPLE